jgi:hypothetical protein
MSSSVSQLEFWLASSSDASDKDKEKEGGEEATYLSYNVLMALSVFGGFFALDHLYLRSPLTFLSKIIVNLLCFGVWWIYDACQIVFNSHNVKVFGLGVPGIGPYGIGAGVLANPVADKKHMRFFYYAIGLIFGGAIGLDSFVISNNQWGVARLVSLISVIFIPFSLSVWAYNLFNFFTDTKSVINEHSEYFGAPEHSLSSGFLSRFPFLSSLFSPFQTLKNFLNNIIGDAIEPITELGMQVTKTVDDTVITGKSAIDLGKAAIEKGTEIIDKVSETVDKVSRAQGVLPGASMYSTITDQSVQKELGRSNTAAAMTGGAIIAATHLNTVHYVLIVTIVTIVLGGVIVTYHRSKNVPEQRDDAPPNPGVFRKPDPKGHAA